VTSQQRRILGSLVLALCLLALAGFTFEQVRAAIETYGKGLDFAPLRHAAVALLHGTSIYSDSRFVYPPTAAVAALPLAAGGYSSTLDVWLSLSAACVALAAFLALAPWQRGVRLLLAVVAAAVLVKSDALRDTLWLGNVSLLLAPVAVAVLVLYEAGRWRAGTALLVISLLVKPLLLPLLLLPLLRGRWGALVESLAAGLAVLALAIVLLPSGGHFFAVLRYLEGGSSLTGRGAVYNISISGLAARIGASSAGWAARALVVAAALAAAWLWARRPAQHGSTAAMGTLLLLAVFLAGPLAEDHYLLVAAPCLLVALAATGNAAAGAAALPALVLVAFPRSLAGGAAGSPGDLQVRYVLAELALALPAGMVALEGSPLRWRGHVRRVAARRA
jgi:hypothetical protein